MIADISLGGLSFSYLPEKTSLEGFKHVDIYMGENEFRLSDIPCAIVYDTVDSATGSKRDTCRRCGLRFGQMKDEHKNKLNYFFKQFYHWVEKRLAIRGHRRQ
jgi:c-di-GMP-binding flagellar brake protein YcgR